jgi:hypothetical protein
MSSLPLPAYYIAIPCCYVNSVVPEWPTKIEAFK